MGYKLSSTFNLYLHIYCKIKWAEFTMSYVPLDVATTVNELHLY